MPVTRSKRKISPVEEKETWDVINRSKRGKLCSSHRLNSDEQHARTGEQPHAEMPIHDLPAATAERTESTGDGDLPSEFETNAVMLCTGDTAGGPRDRRDWVHLTAFSFSHLQTLQPLEIVTTSHDNLYYTFLVMPTHEAARKLIGQPFKTFRRNKKTFRFMPVPKARELRTALMNRDLDAFKDVMTTINEYAQENGIVPGRTKEFRAKPKESNYVFLNESPVDKLAEHELIEERLAYEIDKERRKAPFVHWGEVCERMQLITPRGARRLQEHGHEVKLTSEWWYANNKYKHDRTVASTAGYVITLSPAGAALDPRFREENSDHMIEQELEKETGMYDLASFSREVRADGSMTVEE